MENLMLISPAGYFIIVAFLLGVIFASIFYFFIHLERNRHYEREISRLGMIIQFRDKTVSGLQDRWMSQSLGEYKAFEVPIPSPPPSPPVKDETVGVMDPTIGRMKVDEQE